MCILVVQQALLQDSSKAVVVCKLLSIFSWHVDCHAGRIDAKQADASGRLPAENFTADQLKQAFQQQGLSVQEFVALAGAHTVMPTSHRSHHCTQAVLLLQCA